jgi:molybdopterin synthase catalytic subunit
MASRSAIPLVKLEVATSQWKLVRSKYFLVSCRCENRELYFGKYQTFMVLLTNDPIDYTALTESVRSPAAGAAVLFLGTVREMTAGRQTLALDYEAYPEMAQAKMAELEATARQRWPAVEIGMIHRLGHLELGDISVAIAVSTPHRQQAFEAGKFLIDEFKLVVPIWKKENWSDGSTEWVHPGSPGMVRTSPTTGS